MTEQSDEGDAWTNSDGTENAEITPETSPLWGPLPPGTMPAEPELEKPPPVSIATIEGDLNKLDADQEDSD